MKRAGKWSAAGAGLLGVAILSMAAAWACVSGPAVNLSTVQAKAGQEVGIKGASFRNPDDVIVRFNALDGPVLTTITPTPSPSFGKDIEGSFIVPQGTKPGSYVVIATQNDANGKMSLAPVRVLLTVVGDGGTAPVLGAPANPVDQRTPGLVRNDQSISTGTLALIALGVGGVGMFLAGMAALFVGRRGGAAEPARVRS